MRVRIRADDMTPALAEQFPRAGTVLHPETNRVEWAVVALDRPICHRGRPIGLLCLRPRLPGAAVGDARAVPVHVALVVGESVVDGVRGYRLGDLVGLALCEAEGAASQGTVFPHEA